MSNSTLHKDLLPFINNCEKMASKIEQNESKLYSLLSSYETYSTIKDEVERSIATLRGAEKEFINIKEPLKNLNISTFFPLNLPLYSLTLFAVMPSAFAGQVYVRPPEVMQEVLEKLWDILSIDSLFPVISLKITPRNVFLQLYASESDAIIFTGKYKNAVQIHRACPKTVLLYNGSGINPFILFENCDIDLAVSKAIEMRCFNSGQDCAGPDAFFVPSSKAKDFVKKLQDELPRIKVGNTKDIEVMVGPTIKTKYIDEIKRWLQKNSKFVVSLGDIDENRHVVHPTIIVKSVGQHNGSDFHEFFAPFFYIIVYENISELEDILSKDSFTDRGMYVSIFGNNKSVERNLRSTRILRNKIVNDVERGNTAYGGYGKKANFVLLNNRKRVRPILISRELHQSLKP